MSLATVMAPEGVRPVTVDVSFGVADVERAADSMGIELSSCEREAIVANIEYELASLSSAAVRSAILSRVFEEIRAAQFGHTITEDD